MRQFNKTFVLLAFGLLGPLAQGDTAVEKFSVGISLAYERFTSAYYDSNNQLHVLANIPSSKAWQKYFLETLEDDANHAEYSDSKNLALGSKSLSAIVDATRKALSGEGLDSDQIDFRAISVPQHFENTPSRLNIMYSAVEKGFEVNEEQVISHFNSARLAYGLDNCLAYGLPEGCDVDRNVNIVLIVDLGPTYLSLGFSIAGGTFHAPYAAQHLTDFWDEPEEKEAESKSITLPTSTGEMIKSFLSEQLETLVDDVPDASSHVAAVILTGEASNDSMEAMKAILRSSLPEYNEKFKFEIEPKIIGARGAAHRARETAEGLFAPQPSADDDIEPESQHPHEEL